MRTFSLIWAGQLVSLVGSGLTRFAIGVWVFQQTGSAIDLSLLYVAALLPGVLVAPWAGVLIDRWNRRWTMLLSDSVAAVVMLSIFVPAISEQLALWHVYLAASILSIAESIQWPAYRAAIPQLVPSESLGRANGLTEVAEGVSQLIAPVVAGALLGLIQLRGILLIDFGTFLFAFVTLMAVRIPDTPVSAAQQESLAPLKEARDGIRHLAAARGLLGLLSLFAARNLLVGMATVLLTPLILSFSTEATLGVTLSIGGIGMLLGSVLISIWGGPKRMVLGIVVFQLLTGAAISVAGFRPSVYWIASALFVAMFALPITRSSHQTIWQRKIEPRMQGRLFALRRMVMTSVLPISYLCAGPLADWVFEPFMRGDSEMAQMVGSLIGYGPGRGIGLLFILIGILAEMATILAYLYPRIRYVESEIPDALPDILVREPVDAETVPVA